MDPPQLSVLRPSTPTQDDSKLVTRARAIITSGKYAILDDTDQAQLELMLEISPNPRYTAQKIIDEHDNLYSICNSIRKGCAFLKLGGKRNRKKIEGGDTGYYPSQNTQNYADRSLPLTSAAMTQHNEVDVPTSYQVPRRKSESSRSSSFRKRMLTRSGAPLCEISGLAFGDPRKRTVEAAHILSVAINGDHPDREYLFSLLRCFWNEDDVELLRTIAAKDQICRTANGLLLQPSVHKQFDRLYYYLEPIFDDVDYPMTDDKYFCTFRWRGEAGAIPSYWNDPVYVKDNPAPHFPNMMDGQIIQFSTQDATAYPLPDAILLWVRSIIARVAYPTGSGSDTESFIYSDSDIDSIYTDNAVNELDITSSICTSPAFDSAYMSEARSAPVKRDEVHLPDRSRLVEWLEDQHKASTIEQGLRNANCKNWGYINWGVIFPSIFVVLGIILAIRQEANSTLFLSNTF